ncbi:Calcium-independent phospholipase A2-gamma [Lachnellula hyalina]|uniref:Calcium-independent phospholipase A2-gamma n=1 Tax=Lachnellula hyalina TaxID=1316788 RepID=A0A8H8TXG6_9HELO|nr:Calcium-independent phospholipase A2-gamma [Lachnellula hyalina]TVY22961.1 Calcium-independent phospholipase A2-gamma [Lachnellula hyalina]
MAQMHTKAVASDSPLNRDGLCILSLDGGGVRGLSTLLIIKALMGKVNAERRKNGQSAVKPCELFDLIGGTSTGGIIAIMLGRLEMDVDECIEKYTNMFETIFGKKGLPVNLLGKIKGRFDSTVLEECINRILRERGLPEGALLNDGEERCKVVVCAKASELTTTVLLRSYTSDDALNNILATICEAARATSAASSFFEPVTIGPRGRKYVDGGLGANNPVEQLWNEAQSIWCHDGATELSALLKCFVSIGTGNPGRKPIAEGSLKFFSQTLVGIATQTEDTAKIFVTRHRLLYETKRYFRFNVQQGLQGVGLEEYKAAGLIDAATAEYMDGQESKSAAHECAVNLQQKHLHKAITFIPFAQNDGLVNRDDIFKALDQLLASLSCNRSVALWGLGGCGKTQIALEYAYRRQRETSCSIFWVHADSEATFTLDYTKIARVAGISPDLKGEDLLEVVRQWIEQQKDWLLILDNADDLRMFKTTYSNSQMQAATGPELFRFVPKSRTGTILWTSRDGSILDNILGTKHGVEVGAMTSDQSWDLFRELSGRDNTEPSEEEDRLLLELLERLPLAISQAAAYIRRTKISVQQYLKFFYESEGRKSALLSHEFQDPYRPQVPNSIMHTWLISMKQIAEESPCGEKILKTIAFFDNKGLPFELIRASAGSTFSEDEVLLATSRLCEFSFFQGQRAVGEDLPTYEQHRLTHLVTRRALNRTQISSFSGDAISVIGDLFPTGTHETWSDCALYLPHALKAAAWKEADRYKDEAPGLFTRIGRYYWEQGRSDKAEQLEVEVLKLRKEVLGAKHPDTIRAIANLASTWWQQGRSDEAEQLGVEVLELQKEVLGAKHPDTSTV